MREMFLAIAGFIVLLIGADWLFTGAHYTNTFVKFFFG